MSPQQLLSGLRVVELSGELGDTAVQWLVSLGATLTRVTQPADVLPLIEATDVLVEYEGAARMQACSLGPEQLRALNPRLIHASLTAFGSHGPYARFRGRELICSAMGGVLRMVGDPDRPPVKEALDACLFHAHAAAAAAIMLAYHERAHSGRGQHVDVSVQEVAASRLTNAVVLWQFDRRTLHRSGNELRYGRAAVRCVWRLRDGYTFHTLMSGRFGAPANAALSAWMDELGYDNPLRDVDWLRYDRSALPPETRAVWEAAIERFFGERTKAELAGEGRVRGINAAVLHEPADVLEDPQLAARDFWRSLGGRAPTDQEHLRASVRVPGPFMRVQPGEPVASEHPAAMGSGASRGVRPSALAGVKVLDLSWALVGALSTKALGDHGATVVKVESARRPCLTRTDVQVNRSTRESLDDKPWFAQLNTSKLSLALDLKHARAREVIEPLVAWADVVVENFSPGTLDKLGLGYETLRQQRPELIMISASAYGQTGPLRESWGVDGTSAALSSRTFLTGWPDRDPVVPGALPYADVVVPQWMVAGLVAALMSRGQTGRGCYLDISMYEISVHQMTRALLAAQLGHNPRRAGNRDARVWHQGVYPTLSQDGWIAVSLFDRQDYERLRGLLPGLWPSAEAVEQGDAALDELDATLASRTRTHDARALMHALQQGGIAAGVVQDVADLLERDPQLRDRPAWVSLDHALLGPFEHQTTPYHLERTPAYATSAPRLGEHCALVCQQMLGLAPQHYQSLLDAGVFR